MSIHYGFIEKYASLIFGKSPANFEWRIKENDKIIAKGDFLKWEGDKENTLTERVHSYISIEDSNILGEPCDYCFDPLCTCAPIIYRPTGICYLVS